MYEIDVLRGYWRQGGKKQNSGPSTHSQGGCVNTNVRIWKVNMLWNCEVSYIAINYNKDQNNDNKLF